MFKMSTPSKNTIKLPSFYELESSALQRRPRNSYQSPSNFRFPSSFDDDRLTCSGDFVDSEPKHTLYIGKGHSRSASQKSALQYSPVSESSETSYYDESDSKLSHRRAHSLAIPPTFGHSHKNSLISTLEFADQAYVPRQKHKRQKSQHSVSPTKAQREKLDGISRKLAALEEEEELDVFRKIESSLMSCNYITNVMTDVKNDLIGKITANDDKCGQKIYLNYKIAPESNHLTFPSVNEFLNNIPTPVLDMAIDSASKILEGLEAWKEYKYFKQQSAQPVRPSIFPHLSAPVTGPASAPTELAAGLSAAPMSTKTHSQSYPSDSSGSFLLAPPILLPSRATMSELPSARVRHDHDGLYQPLPLQELSNNMPIRQTSISRTSSQDMPSFGKAAAKQSKKSNLKKRKHSKNLNGNEVISLRVKPTRLMNDEKQTNNIQPPSRKAQGQLHPELSIKQELVCLQCGRKDTPEWRRGPEGARTLCNACGLFHSKLLKKMGLAAANQYLLELREKGIKDVRKLPKDLL